MMRSDRHQVRTRPGILLADDEEAIRFLLTSVLLNRGFEVWQAANGRDAVEVYRSHRNDIDLVLLDVRMPEMDGPEALAAIQAINPEVRACFMSGDLGRWTMQELLAMGAYQVFSKPFAPVELANTLRHMLDANHRRTL